MFIFGGAGVIFEGLKEVMIFFFMLGSFRNFRIVKISFGSLVMVCSFVLSMFRFFIFKFIIFEEFIICEYLEMLFWDFLFRNRIRCWGILFFIRFLVDLIKRFFVICFRVLLVFNGDFFLNFRRRMVSSTAVRDL